MKGEQLELGLSLRDAGMDRVEESSGVWFKRALAAVPAALDGLPDEFVAEDLRRLLTRMVGPPHHPNAWGALTSRARKKNLFFSTGRWTQATDPRSHACTVPIYRKGI